MDLKKVLGNHLKWLKDEPGGERADLRGADLRDADLRGAYLRGANLLDADLCGADLRDADLRGADLRGANLLDADLCGADLRDANLLDADLCGADLRDADLRGADLCDANLLDADLRDADLRGADLRDANLLNAKQLDKCYWNIYTAFYPMQCPESGSYIGYKKARGLIVKLEITEDALRSSATSRKCRASKAKVLSITHVNGDPAGEFIESGYDSSFVYTVGETVEVKNFDTNRWNECAPGIHHFITREEAVKYN